MPNYTVNELGIPEYEVTPQIEQEIARMKDASASVKSCQSDVEEGFKRHEMNELAVSKFRWARQEELAEARTGRILSMGEFLRLIRTIRPDSYYNGWSIRGLVGMNFIVHDDDGTHAETGATVQLGFMPEYSTMNFDAYGVPTREKYRGWRTTILHLINKKLITAEQATKVFGEPLGYLANRYLRSLWEIRNTRAFVGDVR